MRAAARWAALALAVTGADAFGEVEPGVVNTFEQPFRTEGWVNVGVGESIATQVADGGPDGAGDGFMRVRSTGPQPVARCRDLFIGIEIECGAFFEIDNLDDAWSGDYLGAGVRAVQMSVRNFGDRPVPLKMAFSSIGSPGGHWWVTRRPQTLAAASGWQTVTFSLLQQDLIRTQSISSEGRDYGEAFSRINRARLLANSNDGVEETQRGDKIAHDVGVDDITLLREAPPAPSLPLFSDGFED